MSTKAPPAAKPAKPEKRSKQTPRPGVEPGDHLYVQHPERGPIAVKVVAHGADGVVGDCDQGRRWTVPWDRVLGHRARMLHTYKMVEQGADGALLEGDDGKRRYLEGQVPKEVTPSGLAEDEPEPAAGRTTDDPLTGRMDRLAKALDDGARVLFAKAAAGAVANRPGLALQDRTDKLGRHEKRWVRTNKEQPKPRREAQARPAAPAHGAPMEHGQVVAFRHGDVGGKGKIVGSGADGVTVRTPHGEQQVRHEHIVQPGGAEASSKAPDQARGSADKPASPGADGASPPPLFDERLIAGLPPKANQPTADEAELYAKSDEALAQLKTWLNEGKGLCSQLGYETVDKSKGEPDLTKPGGLLFIAPLKGKKRAAEKVESDYGGDWSQLRDVVRCSIAVDTMEQVKSTLEALTKGGMKLAMRPKDRFHTPVPVGYRDCLMNVQFLNGVIGEVQLHVKPMLLAKEQGHRHYEAERTLDAEAKAAGGKLDDAKAKQLRDAQEQQKAIYNQAWQAAVSGGMGGMAKALEGGEGGFSYFEHEGAHYRRKNNGLTRSVDDVLRGEAWTPYKGSDPLEPALFGSECGDPLGGGGGSGESRDTQMTKAQPLRAAGPRVLFLKAVIPHAGTADLFSVPVAVAGYTTKDGAYVAPHHATRRKRVELPPAKPEITPGMPGAKQSDGLAPHVPQARNAVAAAPVAERDAEAAAEPDHIREMRAKLAGSKNRMGGYSTASAEKAAKVYETRLAADPAKWKAGYGVRRGVMESGGMAQWNRGLRVVEVSAPDRMARIRQVADTGLTSTGGNNDRIGDEWVYLGDLRRDKKYDAGGG